MFIDCTLPSRLGNAFKPLLGTAMFFVAASSGVAHGEPLSELAFAHRCYAHLTGVPLPLEHPARRALQEGTMTALELCEGLLDSATLRSSGRVAGELYGEPQLVLQNLYDMHRSWFERGVWEHMQGYNEDESRGTHDLFDSTEPALALTHALLTAQPYREMVEGRGGYRALRQIDPTLLDDRSHYLLASRRLRQHLDNDAGAYLLIKRAGRSFRRSKPDTTRVVPLPEPVQIGELMGITRESRSFFIDDYSPHTNKFTVPIDHGAVHTLAASDAPGMISRIDIFETHGSGILGLNSFLWINSGHDVGRAQDGALKMPRRWVQAFFQSLLCRELPAVRQSDIGEWVVDPLTLPEGSTAVAFRTSPTCVQCHATMDQMAMTARNLVVSQSEADYAAFPGPDGYGPKTTQVTGRFQAEFDDGYDWPASADERFPRERPLGIVLFRSVTGELVREEVEGLEQVGPVIAAQPDMYQCAASRYLAHFTGVHIPLYDPGDPANFSTIDSESREVQVLRRFVQEVGARLSETQSLRDALVAILRSDIYRDRNYLQPLGEGGDE